MIYETCIEARTYIIFFEYKIWSKDYESSFYDNNVGNLYCFCNMYYVIRKVYTIPYLLYKAVIFSSDDHYYYCYYKCCFSTTRVFA